MEAGNPSSQQRDWFNEESRKYLALYYEMRKSLKMSKPQTFQRIDPRILR